MIAVNGTSYCSRCRHGAPDRARDFAKGDGQRLIVKRHARGPDSSLVIREASPYSCVRFGILAFDFQYLRSMLDLEARIENRTLNFEIVRPFSKLNARF